MAPDLDMAFALDLDMALALAMALATGLALALATALVVDLALALAVALALNHVWNRVTKTVIPLSGNRSFVCGVCRCRGHHPAGGGWCG